MGLLKGFLPYLSANKGIGGGKLDNAKVLALAKATEAPFTKIEIINPTAEAFNDFNSPILQKTLGTKQKVIPNKLTDMEKLKSKPGASSGVNISEANVLKLRITYGYKPTIPLVGGFFAKAFDFLSGPKDAFSAMLFASNRIPIVVDVSSQMLSPAIQNTLKVASNNPGTGTGTVGDNHQLPDLSTVKLPGKYEGMSREEIIEDIRANGGINTDSNTSNKDWLKLLIALGIITLGASQMDDIDDAFDANGNIVDSDLVSDFQNQNTCLAGSSGYGVGITNNGSQASPTNDPFQVNNPFQSNLVPIAGAGAVGGAEIAAGGAILGGAACAANKYCPELIGDILTSAGNGLQNAVDGVVGVFSSDGPKTGNDELDEVLGDAVPTDDGNKGYDYPGTQEELIEKLGGIEGANQTKRPDGSTSTTLPDGRRVDTYPGRTSTQKPGWQIIKPGRRKPTHKGQTQ